jgi:GDP-L-fucose synthase
MIHRAFLAKQNNEKMIVWGDGSPLRQLIYSDDLAKLILWSMDNWDNENAFMAINPVEVTILEAAYTICNNFGIDTNDLVFDDTKPRGPYRKPAISSAPADFTFTNLQDGIKEVVEWFKNTYPNIRK